jgi:hypothetical protein
MECYKLRWRQCNRSGLHHIRITINSLNLELMPDWLHVTSRQLWSFKLIEYASNRLRTHSDYHLVLKDGSHDQSEQDVKDFYWIEETLGYSHIFFKLHGYIIQESTLGYSHIFFKLHGYIIQEST